MHSMCFWLIMLTENSAKYITVFGLYNLLSTYCGIYDFNPTNSNTCNLLKCDITTKGGGFVLAIRVKCVMYVQR